MSKATLSILDMEENPQSTKTFTKFTTVKCLFFATVTGQVCQNVFGFECTSDHGKKFATKVRPIRTHAQIVDMFPGCKSIN